MTLPIYINPELTNVICVRALPARDKDGNVIPKLHTIWATRVDNTEFMVADMVDSQEAETIMGELTKRLDKFIVFEELQGCEIEPHKHEGEASDEATQSAYGAIHKERDEAIAGKGIPTEYLKPSRKYNAANGVLIFIDSVDNGVAYGHYNTIDSGSFKTKHDIYTGKCMFVALMETRKNSILSDWDIVTDG